MNKDTILIGVIVVVGILSAVNAYISGKSIKETDVMAVHANAKISMMMSAAGGLILFITAGYYSMKGSWK